MNIKWPKFNRKIHYWGSIICALPILIVLVTGSLLLLKKDFFWVQPATAHGIAGTPSVTMDEILSAAKSLPELGIQAWEDIDRLDIRPGKGIIKIRGNNHWEVQISQYTAEVLQVEYRRSDIIESIHDGSFFHDRVKLGIFLPSAIILLGLWITGMYLFIITHLGKRRSRLKRKL